jgi:N-acetylmuramoyl-L-alanine amidase
MLSLMVCGCLYLRNLFTKNHDGIKSMLGLHIMSTDDSYQTDDIAAGLHIVIDAGHGGADSGTIVENVEEKNVNLAVALKLQTILEQHGAEVTMTRSGDEYVSLSDRTSLANENGADVFVSLHCNYYEYDESIAGLECYYMSQSAEASKQYAQNIVDIAAQSGEITTRKAETEDYFVLRSTTMPAVLVEMGYLSNKAEREKLLTDEYQNLIAENIADGLIQAL